MQLTAKTRKQITPEVLAYIEQIENDANASQQRVKQLESRNEQLVEELRIALYRKFGRSSERTNDSPGPQLFEEAEVTDQDTIEDNSESTVTVAAHTKKKPGRKRLDDSLPREEIVHDIAEDDKQCRCGHAMVRIGEEVSERLQIVPEQVWVERHIRPKYACHHCEGSGDEDRPAVRIMPAEPSLMPGSIATPTLLAFIFVNKFVDHLPFYRQEKRFERIGAHISRQDMSHWAISASQRIAPLIGLLRGMIREGPVIHMDETRMQVLGEADRANTTQSFMWLALGGPSDAPVCLYHYEPTRGGDYARELLGGVQQTYLQVDGYEVYDKVTEANPGVTIVGCWAHVRRKFHEAANAGKKTAAAREAVSRIGKLYAIEKELRAKVRDPQQFLTERRARVEGELVALRQWLEKKADTVIPSSLLGKAVSYSLRQWDKLVRYLDHPDLGPDNSAAERAIRPFVVGRKNWMTSGSPRGAASSCALYSLIETAKLNGLNPHAYLTHVFAEAATITEESQWEALLPQNLDAERVNSSLLVPVR